MNTVEEIKAPIEIDQRVINGELVVIEKFDATMVDLVEVLERTNSTGLLIVSKNGGFNSDDFIRNRYTVITRYLLPYGYEIKWFSEN